MEFIHPNWDLAAVLFVNGFCGKSLFLDTIALIFLTTDAFRSAILVALVMGIWEYGRVKKDIKSHKRAIAIMLSMLLSLATVETINYTFISPRPIIAHSEQINRPITIEKTENLWSSKWTDEVSHRSFPSDTLAFLAVFPFGLLLWNRALGYFALAFAILIGFIPRLYFGLHYPLDLLVGLMIGGLSVLAVERIKLFDKISDKVIHYCEKFPYAMGVFGFYVAYLMSEKLVLLQKIPSWLKILSEAY